MAALMAVALLVLIVQDLPLSNYLRQVETDRLVTSLERDAFILAGRSEENLENPAGTDAGALTAAARSYRGSGGGRVVIVNAQGIALVTSDDDQSIVGASYSSRPEIVRALRGTITSGTRYSETLQIDLLYVAVPVVNGQKTIGAVRLTFPKQFVTDVVNRQLSMLGLVAVITVLLAGIVGLIFSTTVTRRLKLLQHTTELLAEGDLDARADENSGAPELRSLAISFNQMAGRLEILIGQQRTFAADASHQLRTPLTALRLRLERARELLETEVTARGTTDPPSVPVAAAIERLTAAEAETDRLGSILEGLLLLSRAESAVLPLVECDLAVVARQRVDHWWPLAQELGINISFDGPEHATVRAVATAPEQIIDNYIDNALSASSQGDEISVEVRQADNLVQVSVLDEGPGLSREDCARAFDRFWRADSDALGTGLGLAIVAQLAAASRAVAQLEPRNSGGLSATAAFTSSNRETNDPKL